MNIQPITQDAPLCFGVCCHLHRTCQRYQQMDGASPAVLRIDYCGPEYALYIPVLPPMPLIELAAQSGHA